MTPQESKMLDDLMARVDATRLEEKDPEAAARVEQWVARNRDAAYILAQTVLVQNYALEQARQQIQSLQQQQLPPQPAKATSFLGNLFGHKDEAPPQRPPAAPAYAQQPGYAQVPQYPQSYPQPAAAPAFAAPPGGGSSFLRSAATTAAGVAAGALAFEGVESLMHGFGHAAGFGGGGFGGGMGEFGGRPEETVINNYYDTPAPGDAGAANADLQQFQHAGDGGLSTQQDVADDVNVGNDDTQLASDTDLPNIDDDADSYDTASADDSSFDDGGGDFSSDS
jgi:uncharacterized protein